MCGHRVLVAAQSNLALVVLMLMVLSLEEALSVLDRHVRTNPALALVSQQLVHKDATLNSDALTASTLLSAGAMILWTSSALKC